MKASNIILFILFLSGAVQAQVRPSTIAKPRNPNLLVNIKQRNIETEQQNFAKRSNTNEAWFYENANYGGRKFVLERGSYSLKELGNDLNDFLSSAIIPSNLIVVCYTNDNFSGDWYILKPDNESNLNFENATVAKAKVNDRLISGKANINDVVSSIVVYNPEQDYVLINGFGNENNTIIDLGNYNDSSDKSYKAFPAPYINGVDGHNMNALGILNDKIRDIFLSNSAITISIHQDANFKGYHCLLKKELRDYGGKIEDRQNLTLISLTDCGTITAIIGADRAWANRVSSFKVNIAPGRITEITK